MLKRKEEWFMKKRLALFMAATVLATMLAGCGSSSSSSAGGCGHFIDYMANPILILYSAGLNPPRDILILVSRYHTI
jgi:ABC-type glycerol-3-phosphate transport system substrate-binding protein